MPRREPTEEDPSPEWMLERSLDRLAMIDAMLLAQEHAVEILQVVEAQEDRESAIAALMDGFGFGRMGVDYALDLRFSQMTKRGKEALRAERGKLIAEQDALREAIANQSS